MKFLKNAAAIVVAVFMLVMPAGAEDEKKYIKWVDFGVTAQALADAASLDIKSYESGSRADWVSALAHLGAKYGGDFPVIKRATSKPPLKSSPLIRRRLMTRNIIRIISRHTER